jgi:hypothetical protein
MASKPKLKTIPNARQVLNNAFTEPGTAEWTFITPEGYQLDELLIDLVLTTTGTTTAGTPATLVDTIKAFAENQVMEIDGYALPLAVVATHVFEADETGEGFEGSPGNPLACRDPAVTSAGTYYACYRIKAPLPGSAIKVVLATKAGTGLLVGATALVMSASCVAIYTKEVKEQYTLFARQAASATKRTYNGVLKAMFASGSNFATVSDGLRLETDLTPEQILAKQSMGADEARGLSTNGSGVARTSGPLLVTDPKGSGTLGIGTTVGAYMLQMRVDEMKQANLGFNTATTFMAIIFSKIPTPQILEG